MGEQLIARPAVARDLLGGEHAQPVGGREGSRHVVLLSVNASISATA